MIDNEIYNLFCNNPLVNLKKYVLLEIFYFIPYQSFSFCKIRAFAAIKEIENGRNGHCF